MLQIIGWLGCVYLIVKGLEILATANRNAEGKLHFAAIAASVIAFVAAIVFFVILNEQASASPFGASSSSSVSDPNALTPDQMNAIDLNAVDMNATDMNATDMQPTDMNAVLMN